MFGFKMCKGADVKQFVPQPDLSYVFVDTDGEQFKTVKVNGYYFPLDEDGTISDGYDLNTGERVYVYDTHTNQRAEIFYEFCNLTYRYVLEHRMPKGVTVSKFVVEPMAL